jgi:hypothetical protein
MAAVDRRPVTVPQAARSEHKIFAFTGAGTVAVTGN